MLIEHTGKPVFVAAYEQEGAAPDAELNQIRHSTTVSPTTDTWRDCQFTSAVTESYTAIVCEGDFEKSSCLMVFMADTIRGFNLRRYNGGLTGPGADVSFLN